MTFDRQDSVDFDTIEEALAYEPKWDLCQIKYDGIWARVEVTAHNIAYATARWFSRTGELKHMQGLSEPNRLGDGVYVGEFMFGSHWSQQDEYNGKTFLFDILQDGTSDLRDVEYARRYSILCDRVKSAQPSENIRIVACFGINLAPKLWERVQTLRYEGIIFRHSKGLYNDRIGRLKREVTFDYVVMGLIEGNGKHVGRMGALLLGVYQGGRLVPVIGVNGKQAKVGGGFSDKEREYIWDAPDHYIGRVIECVGKGQFPSGALRHPNFVRFRDDKRPEECKWETLPE